jgi:hypothetical protein
MGKSSYYIKGIVLGIIALFIGAGVVPSISGNIGFSPAMDQGDSDCDIKTRTMELDFSDPQVELEGRYAEVNMKETDSYTMVPGEPMLPIYNHVMTFPLGTEIVDVKCKFSTYETIHISRKIMPAPEPVSAGIDIVQQEWFNKDVYQSSELYPLKEYTYHMGGGLHDGDHVTFLSVHLYPVRYSPSLNQINYATTASIIVKYREATQITSEADDRYSFLIISPSEFSDNLQPLVEHKNNHNISTKIVTLEEINGEGRDKQEQIKYYIKHEIENCAIKYVLLVGNSDKMPVRYSYTAEELRLDPFITDLYYADVYSSNGSFCSWDANGNDKFGEMDSDATMLDCMDLYPDVYIGRFLCSDSSEIDTIVNKIINYEENMYNQEWFKKIILCGGNTHQKFIEILLNYRGFEGEITCNEVKKIMNDFNSIELYASTFSYFSPFNDNEEIPSSENINKAINNGAGFVLFSGHGSPGTWATHPPIFKHKWIRYSSSDIEDLTNGEKLPVIVLGGCSCGDFSDSTGISSPISWEFVKKENGGAIGSFACTTLSLSLLGTAATHRLNGYMCVHLFKAYSNKLISLGRILSWAQTHYLNDDNALRFDDPSDYLCIEEWTLFGDPTLMIGGYTSENLQPVADAGESYSGSPGQTIRFDGSGSYDPNGIIASYSWNFGDGYNGSGIRPTHSYSNEGTYVITLTVTDNNGLTDTDTTTATIDNLDQTQPDDCGYGMNYYENIWLAQGFTPTFETLTRVELKMFRYHYPSNEIVTTISIRDSLDGSDLVEASVFGDEIPDGGWVEFDFPDINVNPEEKYYRGF